MYKVAIIDDDATELAKTEKLIEETMQEMEGTGLAVMKFHSPDEFLSYIEKQRESKKTDKLFDVIFSDIVMPEKNGVELGMAIRESDTEVPIVYTSSFRDYAFDSYEVHAFSYLLKPIDPEKLREILVRLVKTTEERKDAEISVRTKDGVRTVPMRQIVYVEYKARCIEYHLADGNVLITIYNRGKFEDALEPLAKKKNFIQTHKSYFVNLDYVHEVRTNDVLMENGQEIPISRNQKILVKERYLEYFTGWMQ